MARPHEHWYLFASDVAKVCDLTEHAVEALAAAGEVESEDLHSLLVFTASHLLPKHRKVFQSDIATGNLKSSTSVPKSKLTPSTRQPAENEDGVLRWTVTSAIIVDSLGVSMNSIHLAKSRKQLDPGNLLSLLRFALFAARPDRQAPITGGLFSAPAAHIPAPKKKDLARKEAAAKRRS